MERAPRIVNMIPLVQAKKEPAVIDRLSRAELKKFNSAMIVGLFAAKFMCSLFFIACAVSLIFP